MTTFISNSAGVRNMEKVIRPNAGLFRRAVHAFCCLTMFALFSVSACFGEGFHNALSLQGFTGLLNTPTAEVTDEGKLYLLFSDQEESKWRDRTPRQENYLFSVGLFSIVELGGRVTDAAKVTRDLSANFKVKVPFIPKGRYLPSIAFGVQDIGGGARQLQSRYLVATEELWRLRLSLGYGTGPDRMKGVFGGIELKAFDWLYLIGENDAAETNAGIRLVTPSVLGIPINVQVTAKTSLNHEPGEVEFGFGVQFPLGLDHHGRKPLLPAADVPGRAAGEVGQGRGDAALPGDAAEKPARVPAGHEEAGGERQAFPVPASGGDDELRASLAGLQEKLATAGFQNVRVGEKGHRLLVIEYENSRYNHNELDGLGVVAGMAVTHAPAGLEMLRLVIRNKNIRILQLSAPVADFSGFFADAGKLAALRESLAITTDVADDEGVNFAAGAGNPSRLKSTLVLYPELRTFVAHDFGVFDYVLSIRPDFYLNVWKGGVINARWDIPVSWSENFEEGKPFRSSRRSSQFQRLMLFQAIKTAPAVMANLGGGMIQKDSYGTLNEIMWTPGSGAHRLRFKHLFARDRETHATNEAYLASYRYYFNPLDTYLEGTAGRFFTRDTGFTLELKRFFGDTAFSVYYKNTETAGRERIQVGGVQIAFPLTPRRDMKPYLLQVRGIEEWGYAQETRIVSPGEFNFLDTAVGINPQPPYNLERVFYNRDRLTESYIRKHLLRLRDANMRYN